MATETRETPAQARARLNPTFAEQLYAICNAMTDLPDPVMSWVGRKIGELADRARFLGAQSGEDFDDKIETMLESIETERTGR
jgi:hypothetical protein